MCYIIEFQYCKVGIYIIGKQITVLLESLIDWNLGFVSFVILHTRGQQKPLSTSFTKTAHTCTCTVKK